MSGIFLAALFVCLVRVFCLGVEAVVRNGVGLGLLIERAAEENLRAG